MKRGNLNGNNDRIPSSRSILTSWGERNDERSWTIVESVRPVFARKHRTWHAKSGHFGKPLGARTMPIRKRTTIFSSILARHRRHDDLTVLRLILPWIPCLSLLNIARGLKGEERGGEDSDASIVQRVMKMARSSRGEGNVNKVLNLSACSA